MFIAASPVGLPHTSVPILLNTIFLYHPHLTSHHSWPFSPLFFLLFFLLFLSFLLSSHLLSISSHLQSLLLFLLFLPPHRPFSTVHPLPGLRPFQTATNSISNNINNSIFAVCGLCWTHFGIKRETGRVREREGSGKTREKRREIEREKGSKGLFLVMQKTNRTHKNTRHCSVFLPRLKHSDWLWS